VSFCQRFVDRRSRTHDQMVQAARSGRQNIAEGSRAGATRSKSEIYLTNVARASLDEFLLDYEDFLRQRNFSQWAKDAPEAKQVRSLGRRLSDLSVQAQSSPYAPWLEHPDPDVVANTLICLIHQANYLLDRQIAVLERAIIEKGGYREQLTAARLAEREKERRFADRTDEEM
jgi:restriction system protein